MGKTSATKLENLMKQVDEFVVQAKANSKNNLLTLKVESYALKRQLAREIFSKYKNDNFFTEYKKSGDDFVVKKWAVRNNPPKEKASGEEEKESNPEDGKGAGAGSPSKIEEVS
jgi:hypothetical protein